MQFRYKDYEFKAPSIEAASKHLAIRHGIDASRKCEVKSPDGKWDSVSLPVVEEKKEIVVQPKPPKTMAQIIAEAQAYCKNGPYLPPPSGYARKRVQPTL